LPLVLETACWAGHSIYPDTKMDELRMVALIQAYGSDRIIINNAADWGVSDPLKVPKTVAAMFEAGLDEQTIQTVVWDNPVAFFGQSERLDPDRDPINQSQLWEGNSVLRGQEPVVEPPN